MQDNEAVIVAISVCNVLSDPMPVFRRGVAAVNRRRILMQRVLRQRLPRRVVANAAATRPYDASDWTGAAALVIGGEAEGVGPELQAWGTEEVGIPLDHEVESLNAAVAGAVILFEAARQRRLAHAERAP